MNRKLWYLSSVLLLTLALLPAAPAAADTVARMEIGSAAVNWQPEAVSHAGIQLIVSGPGDFYRVQDFAPGETPTFSLFDAAGQNVPDGVYAYELKTTPVLGAAHRAALAERRDGEIRSVPTGLPRGLVQAGYFSVAEGAFVAPTTEPARQIAERGAGQQSIAERTTFTDSLCVGFDCPASPSFSDSSILMMENNTRIKFGDTSTGAFPANDWEIEANSNVSGGANYLGFNDCGSASNAGGCAADLVFAVEAGVRSSALYVESDGDVGFGTSNPVVSLHAVDGNTPTLRLEQDTSSGFAAQSWDIAGNETSFFIRDATNGSTLPFRVFPGSSSNMLNIRDSGVGVRDLTPDDYLDIDISTTNGGLTIESTTGNGLPQLTLIEDSGSWRFRVNSGGNFVFTDATSGTSPFQIQQGAANNLLNLNGSQVTVNGDFTVTGAKAFRHRDPVEPSRDLYYVALEGPEAGTYYRGTAKTLDGQAVIELPDVFSRITEEKGMTVQLTPIGLHTLYVVERTRDRLVVRDADGKDGVEFDFFVQGVRLGYSDYQVARPAAD